jgi:DNA polymerase IV
MTDLRKIIHVDMDAFFASVEQRDDPDLRGKPVAVGGRPESRGAVAAASYEARAFGVHSAMPSRVAIQRCPQLIFIQPRMAVYKEISQQIRDIFLQHTNLVEPVAFDEAYLDLTGAQSAMAIARQIKQEIFSATQLTASAGVSVNKFLAKVTTLTTKRKAL